MMKIFRILNKKKFWTLDLRTSKKLRQIGYRWFTLVSYFRFLRQLSPPFYIWSHLRCSPSSWWPTSRVTFEACGLSRLLSNSLSRSIKISSQSFSLRMWPKNRTIKTKSVLLLAPADVLPQLHSSICDVKKEKQGKLNLTVNRTILFNQ